jgi:hypothetical protein
MNKRKVKAKKKKEPSEWFMEEYIVNFDYLKPDGFWVCSHEEEVVVPVRHGVNEKNSHERAASRIKSAYPNCRINSVTYC